MLNHSNFSPNVNTKSNFEVPNIIYFDFKCKQTKKSDTDEQRIQKMRNQSRRGMQQNEKKKKHTIENHLCGTSFSRFSFDRNKTTSHTIIALITSKDKFQTNTRLSHWQQWLMVQNVYTKIYVPDCLITLTMDKCFGCASVRCNRCASISFIHLYFRLYVLCTQRNGINLFH